MTPAPAPQSTVADHLDGEREATRVLQLIDQGIADPDRLMRGLTNLFARDGVMVPPTARLRGFARRLQKALEQASAEAASPRSGRSEASS